MTRAGTIAAALGALLVAAGTGDAGAEGGGCRGTRDVDVSVVRSGPQCGGTAPSARLLSSRADLQQAFRTELGPDLPDLDFDRDAVVLVSAGQKPTAGHAIELDAPKASARGNVAALRVRLTRPDPGALVAQVVTSPCLIVRLPREGLSELKVVEGGEIIATVPLR